MISYFKNLFDPSKKILKDAEKVLPQIKTHIAEYEKKSTDELRRIIQKFRDELEEINKKIPTEERDTVRMRRRTDTFNKGEREMYQKLQEIMPKVYAIFTLITDRKAGIRHYDVQLISAMVLASGQKLVEMKTGEGKTNTFHLPLFLYGLTGRGAHLVTVNDYLARRDGEYAGHIFSELGLSVGIITPTASYKFIPDSELKEHKGEEAVKEREEMKGLKISDMHGLNLIECTKDMAYSCDVVVGTNNEFGFDYLRDNMVKSIKRRAQKELYFCIVDEADSILIDEARTPLIISAPADESNKLYTTFAELVPQLKADVDYVIEEKERAVNLTDEGIEKMEMLLGVENIWEDYKLAHHLENALKAEVFYRKDKEYIIRHGEVLIVDEFTGRVLAGRRYSEGLHQAIEAKEGVEIKQESRTLATITFQNFFRLYKILVGGSGTIMTEQEEFFKIYNLEAAPIPTNDPVIREDRSDKIFKSKEAKFNAVVQEIKKINENGQPILVGTTSISDSEAISELLEKMEIEHEVLNAKHHEREAQIVQKAGQVNAVTVATNMAGRGTDIPLGPGAKEKGGLFVIGTERHESRRIDNQLRGRSGRQGDPGVSQFFVALDDQIMRIQGGDVVKRIMDMANLPDDLPLQSKMISGSIERAQKRMEGMYFDSRKHVVEYDDVVNQQREIFYTRRLRYLRLAEEFGQLAGKDKDEAEVSEKLAQTKTKLLEEFRPVISDFAEVLVNQFRLNFMENPDKEQVYKEAVENLLSIGDDSLFLEVVNHLKLYKEELKDSDNLTKILIQKVKSFADKQEKLMDFFEDFLKSAVKIRVDKVRNLSGMVKTIFLDVMDEHWTLHLDFMQDIREGVGLRGVAQLDPLVEYKNEGFKAFKTFISKVNRSALQGLLQTSNTRFDLQDAEVIEFGNIQTNADQIEDLLTGDREFVGGKQNGGAAKNTARAGAVPAALVNNLTPQRRLSRKERRAEARKTKTK